MKKIALLSFLFLVVSFVSFAIAPISGSTTTCVGWVASLTDATPGGTWTSSNPAVATVVATSGSVTGVSVGTATITYRVGTAYVVTGFTVNPADVITGGSSILCAGTSMTLSGSPAGGSWTSGTPTIATVSSTGVVTGVGTGVVNIYYTGGGCYVYKIVTVNAALSPITGTTTVGTGATTTLSNSTLGGSWSSSNTAIANVGSTGIVSGVAAGTCNINYTTGACYVYVPVTVTTSVAPITGVASACAGNTSLLSCATPGGVWSSSNTAIATVSSTGLVAGLVSGAVTIRYTVGSVFVTRSFTVNPVATLSGVSTVCVGTAATFTPSITGGIWSSSNTAIATVSTSGLITGMGAGVATINYNLGGCYTPKTVTVNSMAIISGSSNACVGTTTTLTATPVGGLWSSSSTSVAVVSSAGIVTGVSVGTTNITYSSAGCTAVKAMTVNVIPSVSGGTSVCVGATVPLSGLPSGGTWSSSSSLIALVGSTGVVTGAGAGLAGITYNRFGCTATYNVSVNAIPVILGTTSLCAGSTALLTASPTGGSWTSGSPSVASVGSTGTVTAVSPGVVNIYYTASGCYSFRSITVSSTPAPISGASTLAVGGTTTLSNPTVGGTWSSSNTAIAVIGSVTGIVTGISSGSCSITYSTGSCFVTFSITVFTPAIAPITGPINTCVGSVVLQSDATPGGVWISSDPSIASISSGGYITGISAGTVTITYMVGTGYATRVFYVDPGPTVSGPTTVCTGLPITLTASVSGGTWISGSTSVASVTGTGIVTGVSAGTVTITYNYGGCLGFYPVSVIASPVITGGSSLCTGATMTLAATPAGGSWTSGTPTVATVSSVGLVTGITPGVINIYYTNGGCYTFRTVSVNAGPAPITGSTSVNLGHTIFLSDATPGGTWVSDNPGTATVGPTAGNVFGVSVGTVNIRYWWGGCSVYLPVVVYYSPFGASIPVTADGGSALTTAPTATSHLRMAGQTDVAEISGSDQSGGTIAAFPNPTTGNITVEWNGLNPGSAAILVTDVTGKVVFTRVLDGVQTNGKYTFELSNANDGIYLLRIQSGKTRYSGRLILQH
jgi:trimeric autotransporter adhesin